MNIIKLNAIDSTNSYLKTQNGLFELENFTVAVARHQTAGRGQMGTKWVSEKNKNLTFSMLVRFGELEISNQFYMSMAVAIALVKALEPYVKIPLKIKWPNDILAEGSKIAGILIENTIKRGQIDHAVIGVGLNVNQTIFPSDIGNVSSLKLLTECSYHTDEILLDLIKEMKTYLQFVSEGAFEELQEAYYSNMYKYMEVAVFSNSKGDLISGRIVGVENDGKIRVEQHNKIVCSFDLKELKYVG